MAQAHPPVILSGALRFANAKRNTEPKDPYPLQELSLRNFLPEALKKSAQPVANATGLTPSTTNQLSDLSMNPASSIFNFFNPSLGR